LKRAIIFVLAFVLVSPALPAPAPFHAVTSAHAQQSKQGQPQLVRRLNLLDLLFGGGLRKQRQRSEPPAKTRRVIVAPSRSGAGALAGAQPSQKTVVAKSENAAKVLVVGDFMAGGLHWGLDQAYAGNPDAVIIDKTQGLSGLVRDDVVNWPEAIGSYIEEVKPAIVVIQVGMNDRQQMRVADGKAQKLTPPWKAEYDRRVAAVVKAVRERNIPLIWVGLPPVKTPAMNTDYLVLNETFRASTEAAGGKFVDVWDGFTNAEGQFVSAGPDINGQIVRLRNSDGINMTRAGMSKLAFYVEREIRRMIGLGAQSQVASLSGLDSPAAALEPQYDPATTGRTIVIGLDSPQADGADFLEGGESAANERPDEASMAYTLVAQGVSYIPPPGRVDAAWGKPADEVRRPEPIAATATLAPLPPATVGNPEGMPVPPLPGEGLRGSQPVAAAASEVPASTQAPAAAVQQAERPVRRTQPRPQQQQQRRPVPGLPGVWLPNNERN
jgi:uncharacterized protein